MEWLLVCWGPSERCKTDEVVIDELFERALHDKNPWPACLEAVKMLLGESEIRREVVKARVAYVNIGGCLSESMWNCRFYGSVIRGTQAKISDYL
jgi:hypothetical protein